MCKDLNINNVDLYNNDANYFIPEDDFDIMFTCPPYYNVEIYECGAFNNIEEYNKLINNIFNIFYKKQSCKTLGLVIREDLFIMNDFKYNYKKYNINISQKSHLFNTKENKEYLYVFNK